MPNESSAKVLPALVTGFCLNAFHLFVGEADKATKKIRFRMNPLPIIKKIWRERAMSKNAVAARA